MSKLYLLCCLCFRVTGRCGGRGRGVWAWSSSSEDIVRHGIYNTPHIKTYLTLFNTRASAEESNTQLKIMLPKTFSTCENKRAVSLHGIVWLLYCPTMQFNFPNEFHFKKIKLYALSLNTRTVLYRTVCKTTSLQSLITTTLHVSWLANFSPWNRREPGVSLFSGRQFDLVKIWRKEM